MKQGWSGLFRRLLIIFKTRKEIFATHCFPASSTNSQVHSRSFLGGREAPLLISSHPKKKNHIEKTQLRGLLVYTSFSLSICGGFWSRVQTQLSFLSHNLKILPCRAVSNICPAAIPPRPKEISAGGRGTFSLPLPVFHMTFAGCCLFVAAPWSRESYRDWHLCF